jgi:hypothetical protein
MLDSLDVKTMEALTHAFGTAYTRAKKAGDEAAMRKLTNTYNDMKEALAAPVIQ